MQPLSGLRVLDLTRLLPGGFCSLLLVDLGAEVIKIEEPRGGDPLRGYPQGLFEALNRGKRSVTLDLKTSQGLVLLLELVGSADVLIEGFRPGVLDRLGAGHATLRGTNPRLIVCAITGYGQRGSLNGLPGHDLNYMGYAGALSLFGPRGGGPPSVPGVQVADIGGGAMSAALGILAALLERGRTGEGSVLDISMTASVTHWLILAAAELAATGSSPRAGRGLLQGGYPCYDTYRTADRGTLTVAALETKFWTNFCRKLSRPQYVALQFASWEEQQPIFADLDALFAGRTLQEWLTFFGTDDVCVGPVLDLPDALRLHRPLRDVPAATRDDPAGLGGFFGLAVPGPAPRLGEHTDQMLARLGKSAREIAELRRMGAV